MSGLKDLYRETIRRHAAEPVGFNRPVAATHRCEGHNPQCGDRVEVLLQVSDGRIEDAGFEGEACAICLASTSLMCEQLPGLDATEVVAMGTSLEETLRSPAEPADDGPLAPLHGVRPYPSRVQCALLPWETAARALDSEFSGK